MIGSETTQKEIPVVQEEKSDGAVSSDNLDLEEIMEGIQESITSSTESTKSGVKTKIPLKILQSKYCIVPAE